MDCYSEERAITFIGGGQGERLEKFHEESRIPARNVQELAI